MGSCPLSPKCRPPPLLLLLLPLLLHASSLQLLCCALQPLVDLELCKNQNQNQNQNQHQHQHQNRGGERDCAGPTKVRQQAAGSKQPCAFSRMIQPQMPLCSN